METYQIFSAVFLIAVLVLILPAFVKTNNNLTRLVKKFIYLDCYCTYYYCNYKFILMKKINLSITGCMGRMGQQLIRSVKKIKILILFH